MYGVVFQLIIEIFNSINFKLAIELIEITQFPESPMYPEAIFTVSNLQFIRIKGTTVAGLFPLFFV